MRNIIFILLFAFQAAFTSAATDEERKANELIQDLSRNVNYISSLSDIEPEGVYLMLMIAVKALSTDHNVETSAVALSNQFYQSKHFAVMLKSKRVSFAEMLRLYVDFVGQPNL